MHKRKYRSNGQEAALATIQRLHGVGPEAKMDKLKKGEVVILAREPKLRFTITELIPSEDGLVKIKCGTAMEFYTSIVNKGYDPDYYVDLDQLLIVNHLTVSEQHWLEEQLNRKSTRA